MDSCNALVASAGIDFEKLDQKEVLALTQRMLGGIVNHGLENEVIDISSDDESIEVESPKVSKINVETIESK